MIEKINIINKIYFCFFIIAIFRENIESSRKILTPNFNLQVKISFDLKIFSTA